MPNEVSSKIELLDSEILRLEKVVEALQELQEKPLNLEAFRKDAIERFADAGFRVTALVYDTNITGVYAFDFQIEERLQGEFDPDRMVREVTDDILELGTGGVIKSGGIFKDQMHSHGKVKHSHGGGDGDHAH